MSKMETLKDLLGRWEYRHAAGDKYYNVLPDPKGADSYQIAWGLGLQPARQVIEGITAKEAMRRIRDKRRGGFKLAIPFAAAVPPSASITTAQLEEESTTASKRATTKKPAKAKAKPATVKKRFSFADWAENNS